MKDIEQNENAQKFEHPTRTAKGEERAWVSLEKLETLWVNTGTLCNIECVNCYIESSPTNDQLVYFKESDLRTYLDEIADHNMPVTEIGFTGGEPFMNAEIIDMLRLSLERGFSVLVLTNAMLPMMRRHMRDGLAELNAAYPGKMTLRISLDHHSAKMHDLERGEGSFEKTLIGMRWLRDVGIKMAVAGRTLWDETDMDARAGFAALYQAEGFDIDAHAPAETVLFPEMTGTLDVPEITTACWGILNKDPRELMCSNARMVVRRKGADAPAVLACTLLAYDPQFELGPTLQDANRDVRLNHPHCAKFCVLGGASCSG